jgi:hypothetical protein
MGDVDDGSEPHSPGNLAERYPLSRREKKRRQKIARTEEKEN